MLFLPRRDRPAAGRHYPRVLPQLHVAAVRPVAARLGPGVPCVRALPDDGRVSSTHVDAVWRAAGEAIGGNVALEVAAGAGRTSFGLLSQLLATAPTVGDALRGLVRHYGLLSNGTTHRMQPHGRDVQMQVEVLRPAGPSVQLEQFALAVVLGFVRNEAVVRVVPRQVCFRHDPPSNASAVTDFFGAPSRYGAHTNVLTFRAEDLQIPLRSADVELHEILRQAAGRPNAEAVDVVTEVRDVLLAGRCTKLGEVAAQLGRAPRTLRRQLLGHGTSFQAELDAARRHLAERALSTTDARVADVARQLGFSDPAAFRRAFRRWTGVAPGVFRAWARAA